MRAVKRVNLDVATHAVTGGMLINRSIFCSSFFMNRHPSLFRDRSHRPMSLHGSLFQKNKKLDTLPSVTVILPCSPKHHKAIPDRLLFPRVARLFTDALRGFLHCRRSSLCIAVTISQAITESNLGRHFLARVSCVEGNMIILGQRRYKSHRARLDFVSDLATLVLRKWMRRSHSFTH